MSATWRIVTGDCRAVLASLPEQSVHTCVTSPPYFGLRDYGTEGQIGLEPTPDEFVAALVDVFRGVRRVLRDDGTVWLNLGDSYNAYNGNAGMGGPVGLTQTTQRPKLPKGHGLVVKDAKPKDLLGIPWMVAFALRADGWYLRSDIVWSKPNPMPESVTDRPTKAHEYVFLLSKSARYHYEADAIREPHSREWWDETVPERKLTDDLRPRPKGGWGDGGQRHGNGDPAGRNKRSVWTVATQPYAGAHFATFPPKLIEPCILAGAPERACGECGAPWVRVVKLEGIPGSAYGARRVDKGFAPPCGCACPATAPGVVLDPFCGAGTTGLVALRHGRSFIGVELSPTYAAMARDRIIGDAPLLNIVTEAA